MPLSESHPFMLLQSAAKVRADPATRTGNRAWAEIAERRQLWARSEDKCANTAKAWRAAFQSAGRDWLWVASIRIASGIKQRCVLCGTVFAFGLRLLIPALSALAICLRAHSVFVLAMLP